MLVQKRQVGGKDQLTRGSCEQKSGPVSGQLGVEQPWQRHRSIDKKVLCVAE